MRKQVVPLPAPPLESHHFPAMLGVIFAVFTRLDLSGVTTAISPAISAWHN